MMLSEENIYTHPTFIKYRTQLLWELNFNRIKINNVDELATKGVELVLNVDRVKSRRALNYIKFYSGVDIETMLRVFIGKELSQIIFDISDREDSVIDYFGWVTLSILFGVRI